MKDVKTETYKTVLTIAVGFIIIYYFKRWEWTLIVAIGIGLISLLSFYLSQKIEWVWLKIGWLLSLFAPKILLGLVFYIILCPLGILSRFFGEKDPLNLKRKNRSLFKAVNKEFPKSSFEEIW